MECLKTEMKEYEIALTEIESAYRLSLVKVQQRWLSSYKTIL